MAETEKLVGFFVGLGLRDAFSCYVALSSEDGSLRQSAEFIPFDPAQSTAVVYIFQNFVPV